MARYALQVEVLADGDALVTRTLPPGSALRLGPTPDASIPTTALDRTVEVLVPGRSGYGLRLAAPLSGHLTVSGRALRIEEGLLCDPRPEPLLLRDEDTGELLLGAGLRLRFMVCEQRRRFRWRPEANRTLVLSLAVTAVLTAVGAGWVGRRAPVPRRGVQEARLLARPTRLGLLRAPNRAPGDPTHRPARKPIRRMKVRPGTGRARPAPSRRGVLAPMDRDPRMARRVDGTHGQRDPLNGALAKLDATLASMAMGAPRGRLDSTEADRLAAWIRRGSPADAPHASTPPVATKWGPALASTTPVQGALGHRPTREEIERVVSRGAGPIRLCYERELLSSANPREGTVVIRWEIDPTGKARHLRTLRDSVRLPTLEGCVISQIESWSFPPCEARCVVVFPFEFYLRV
jgi:hypothetical protein